MIQRDTQSVEQAQQLIYDFFLELVRRSPPAKVLEEFSELFIYYAGTSNPKVIHALADVIATLNEKEFQYTLQRCCYILINNWSVNNETQYIQPLINLFTDPYIDQKTQIVKLKILKEWIRNFVQSEAYQSLKFYVARYTEAQKAPWHTRYTSYLLTSQYANVKNPQEQRQIADTHCKKLKYQFKFELAMYTARINSTATNCKPPKNPTSLGHEVLHLAKIVLTRKGKFDYRNLANVFLLKTRNLPYIAFKQELLAYLEFNYDDRDIIPVFYSELVKKSDQLLTSYHNCKTDAKLIQETCKLVISCLTIEKQSQEPTTLFQMFLQQGNPLYLIILLLKVVLVCESSRTHLEICIAELIKYYIKYEENECRSFINFLDMLNVTFAIYAKDTNYELVRMTNPEHGNFAHTDLNNYRIFSQMRKSLENE